MPYQEKQIEKKYFTIGEVAEQLGVATSLLRFWEQEFINLRPALKYKNGSRKYTLEDVEKVNKIHYLVKVRGFTLAGARQELIRQELIRQENPMTIDDYWNVKQELVSWLEPESAAEVEKYLAKLGYKIVKI
jgi:DNA-binding transcriptional MerR regulator